MKIDLFIQKTSNLYIKSLLLKFVVIVIGLALVVNGFYTYKMLAKQRVVIIPASNLKNRVEVGMFEADEEYIKMMARYVSGLFLNFSPGNARSQYSELLGLYSPDAYNDAKAMLYDMADKIETTSVTSVFNLNGIAYVKNPKRGLDIEVKGVRVLYSKDQKIEEKNRKYVINGEVLNARFYVIDIKEVQ